MSRQLYPVPLVVTADIFLKPAFLPSIERRQRFAYCTEENARALIVQAKTRVFTQ